MIAQTVSLSALRPRKALVALVLGIGLVAFASPSAQAALVYSVTETDSTGTPIGATNTTASGLFTDYAYNISVTETAGSLDLAVSVFKLTASTNKILITVSDTGFTAPGNALLSVFSPQASGSSALAGQTFSSTANGSTTTPTGSYNIPAGILPPPPFGPPGVTSTPFAGPTPYSLSNTVLLSLPSSGNFLQVNTRSIVAPEPGTLAMAGMGGIGLVGLGLRRRKGAKV
jgi:hypothetical protein